MRSQDLQIPWELSCKRWASRAPLRDSCRWGHLELELLLDSSGIADGVGQPQAAHTYPARLNPSVVFAPVRTGSSQVTAVPSCLQCFGKGREGAWRHKVPAVAWGNDADGRSFIQRAFE